MSDSRFFSLGVGSCVKTASDSPRSGSSFKRRSTPGLQLVGDAAEGQAGLGGPREDPRRRWDRRPCHRHRTSDHPPFRLEHVVVFVGQPEVFGLLCGLGGLVLLAGRLGQHLGVQRRRCQQLGVGAVGDDRGRRRAGRPGPPG